MCWWIEAGFEAVWGTKDPWVGGRGKHGKCGLRSGTTSTRSRPVWRWSEMPIRQKTTGRHTGGLVAVPGYLSLWIETEIERPAGCLCGRPSIPSPHIGHCWQYPGRSPPLRNLKAMDGFLRGVGRLRQFPRPSPKIITDVFGMLR